MHTPSYPQQTGPPAMEPAGLLTCCSPGCGSEPGHSAASLHEQAEQRPGTGSCAQAAWPAVSVVAQPPSSRFVGGSQRTTAGRKQGSLPRIVSEMSQQLPLPRPRRSTWTANCQPGHSWPYHSPRSRVKFGQLGDCVLVPAVRPLSCCVGAARQRQSSAPRSREGICELEGVEGT